MGTAERALPEIARVLAPGGTLVHEGRLAPVLAHGLPAPARVPWHLAPELVRSRRAGLWAARRRV